MTTVSYMNDDFCTVKEYALLKKVSEETVRRQLRNGKIPGAYRKSKKEGWIIPKNKTKNSNDISSIVDAIVFHVEEIAKLKREELWHLEKIRGYCFDLKYCEKTEANYKYSKIFFRTMEDAHKIAVIMRKEIKRDGYCSVGKYFELCGQKTKPEDFNWGWTNLDNVCAKQDRIEESKDHYIFSYILELPNPVKITKKQTDNFHFWIYL